ncbi:MAG: SMC-Scp complex subunit ScpB [Clostridia bacterium]|nr:SMC-Scp complex subunit ScpB [Clostridia bacterium]
MSGVIDGEYNVPSDEALNKISEANPEEFSGSEEIPEITLSGDEALKFTESLENEAVMNANERLSDQEAIAEALVFASGDPVKIDSIAIAINTDKKEAYRVMDELVEKYRRRNGGIILRKIDRSYLFCTRPELTENLRPFFERPAGTGLSRAAMETLAVVCYNQPVTRAGIEYVRGINSDGVLIRLIEKGLVEECGRSDAPGRPILYGTTTKFLQSMGVESIKELPKVEKIVIREKEADPADVGETAKEQKIDAAQESEAVEPAAEAQTE